MYIFKERDTKLIYAFCGSIDGFFYNKKMSFWDVDNDTLCILPKGCKNVNDTIELDYKKTMSSEKYCNKFKKLTCPDECGRIIDGIISESSIGELVDYFKIFEYADANYIINDTLPCCSYMYIIRMICREKINVIIEIMTFDGRKETDRIELEYNK